MAIASSHIRQDLAGSHRDPDHATSSDALPPSVGSVPRTTFRDPTLQARFARDGFVVVPFFDAAQVAAARRLFTELNGTTGTGFATDFERPDPEHKQVLHDALAAAAGPGLEDLLDRYRPFMASFLAKWPGAGSNLYVHQDWSYVDERIFRSVVVWIALDDVGPELGNGPLTVLTGSHRVAGEHRGTSTTPWHAEHVDTITEALVDVAVPAGHAVVMDNALVHASPDNTTGSVRLAAALACVPEEATLVHSVGRGEAEVDVLVVDDQFFREETPTQLRSRIPDRWTEGMTSQPAAWGPADLELAGRLCGIDLGADLPGGPLQPSAPPTLGDDLASRVASRVLAWHHQLITRAGTDSDPFVDPSEIEWLARLTDAWETIRDEYVAAHATDSRDVPLPVLAGADLPNVGRWEGALLVDHHGWVDDALATYPATCELLRSIPSIRTAMFSVLGPWARIDRHRGPNKGVLRAHLGIVVPDPPAAARLWAGTEHRCWRAGEAFVFDDTFEHRVANQSAQARVSLMIEFNRPLTGIDELVNRVVQAGFGLHPQVRGSVARRRAIQAALDA